MAKSTGMYRVREGGCFELCFGDRGTHSLCVWRLLLSRASILWTGRECRSNRDPPSVHQPPVDLGLINGIYCCFELAILSKICYFYKCSPAFRSICRPEIFLPFSIVFWKIPWKFLSFEVADKSSQINCYLISWGKVTEGGRLPPLLLLGFLSG